MTGQIPHEIDAAVCEAMAVATTVDVRNHGNRLDVDHDGPGFVEALLEQGFAVVPASSAGSQEPNPAGGSVGTDAAGASVVGSQEPAPAETPEWLDMRESYRGGGVMGRRPEPAPAELEDVRALFTRLYDCAYAWAGGDDADGTAKAAFDLRYGEAWAAVERGRDYWRQAYEAADRSLRELTVRGGLARVQEQLDQAREALEAIADERRTSMRWRRATSMQASPEKPNVRMVAMDALDALASGVTEKGDKTHE